MKLPVGAVTISTCRGCLSAIQMGFEQPVDAHAANLLVACDGTRSVRELLARAAAQAGVPADSLVREGIDVITELLRAGFLVANQS